ncbi:nitric oxide synthase-interacting protein isoform X2 [Notamacropus eugenii]|uniref:nitric oxide synthase-interacting protein isoform X2 n=1 Tax=Notamacropus eugenii TaxID=9315 RepID=UPI003B6804E2
MTRHGKNCTAGAVYTYHEKKKDTAASGYGTQNVRLSRDAVKDFDCCCLSLQPCHDPVVTPDGFLYEREAILEYILHQKREIARQTKAYEKQRGAQKEERRELSRAAAQDQLRGFLEKEAAIVSRPLNPFTPRTGASPGEPQLGPNSGPEAGDKEKAKELPSFWIPSLTPEAKATKLEKPGGTDHSERALRLRSDTGQPEQLYPLCRPATFGGCSDCGVCRASDPQRHGRPHQRGSTNRQGHHPTPEGWHWLCRFWGTAGGQEVSPCNAGLKGPSEG